jgi:hypothetical protein
MVESFVNYWPKEIPLLVQLDDDLLLDQVQKLLRADDAISIGWDKDHKAFVERNKGKDDPLNYRKQPVRFCHKVFAIKRALDAITEHKKADVPNKAPAPRYLIWLDADVHTTKPVSLDDVKACLPKEGDAVSYLGRKDWDHSECGWLAFDLESSGVIAINEAVKFYLYDGVLKEPQHHDSWVFDETRKFFGKDNQSGKWTNLTEAATGRDIWPQSPMGKWSIHYKGPAAKSDLTKPQKQKNMQSNIEIQTRNAIPNESIRDNIRINQMMITKWIQPCEATNEEIVVVSAGPMLIAEDVREEVKAGRKIVAVKHALEPLKKAGITPWACILLDPRPHVAEFVKTPDKDVIWFVASQVNPEVTKRLLEAGCNVWGYHATVGAEEGPLIEKQMGAIVSGGSATATRGLYTLNHLGFSNFRLYGYDLCFPERPDLGAKDDMRQPKYLEMSLGFQHPLFSQKRMFYTEPQLIAQFQEINDIIKERKFTLKAFGNGAIPFILKAKETGELRERELKAKIKQTTYQKLLWTKKKSLTSYLPPFSKILRPLTRINSSLRA